MNAQPQVLKYDALHKEHSCVDQMVLSMSECGLTHHAIIKDKAIDGLNCLTGCTSMREQSKSLRHAIL